jgi:flagellar protein FlbD
MPVRSASGVPVVPDGGSAIALPELTRLNQQTITVNPDNILWAEASPDTTLCFLGGEKVLVREGMDELIDRVIQFRRMVSSEFPQSRRDVEG